MKTIRTTILTALCLCLSVSAASAEDRQTPFYPSLTDVGPYETPSRHASGSVIFNLGPTGARGWTQAFDGGELFWGPYGNEILIAAVESQSPADGKLQVFDVLLAANGKVFDNALEDLGRAVAQSQRGDGTLSLLVWRKGTVVTVTLQLPPLPGASVDTPFKAEHSEALREQALQFLRTTMHPDGFRMHHSYGALNALFLLANGKVEDLDLVRRQVQRIIKAMPEDTEYGPWAWVSGSDMTLLSEYYLLTGDDSVLPTLEQYCEWARNSRSYAGGWGHGGPYGGYGHVALPGMFAAVGLTLARECGVEGYDDVIDDARRFYARAAGLGMMNYGGFAAGLGLKTIYGDNGKCGTAAVLFDCLGDEKISRTYANTAAALAPYAESGHTGHFWSVTWGALGASLGETPFRRYFAEETEWYYALARNWRGGLTTQPWRTMWIYPYAGAEMSTGGMALWYCQPLESLRVLGGKRSVLSEDLPEPLATARQQIHEQKYDACLATLTEYKPADETGKAQAASLRAIAEKARKTIELTLADIRANLEKGDLFLAEQQMNALRPILPDEAVVEPFAERLATDDSQAVILAGKTFYDGRTFARSPDGEFFYRAPKIVFNAKAREAMEEVAANPENGYYAEAAKTALQRWAPDFPGPKYTSLIKKEALSLGGRGDLFLSAEADAETGVHYRYVEFDTPPESVRGIREMAPAKEGTTHGFTIAEKRREHNFGFVFNTFLEVTQPGEYRFTLTSDDGSILSVNGEELIDNDGFHGMTPETATLRLPAGRHALECLMFQGAGNTGLSVDVKAESNSQTVLKKLPFDVEDPKGISTLKVSVHAKDPLTVLLNGEVITHYHKKRKKRPYDHSWTEWEEVTLRPEAVELLKPGKNILGVRATDASIGPTSAPVGVELLGR